MAVVFFPHPVPLGRQHLGPSIPVVGLEPAFTLPFPLAVQSLYPCGITTSDNPADSSAAVTIQRLENPSFGFLRPGNDTRGRFPQCLRPQLIDRC